MVLKRGVTWLTGHFAMYLVKYMFHVHPMFIRFIENKVFWNLIKQRISNWFCILLHSVLSLQNVCYGPVTAVIYSTLAIAWTIAPTIFLYFNHNSWTNCKCECVSIVQYILLLKDMFTESQWLSKSHVRLDPKGPFTRCDFFWMRLRFFYRMQWVVWMLIVLFTWCDFMCMRCTGVCDVAHEWVPYLFCAIAMCDSSECDVLPNWHIHS